MFCCKKQMTLFYKLDLKSDNDVPLPSRRRWCFFAADDDSKVYRLMKTEGKLIVDLLLSTIKAKKKVFKKLSFSK